MLGKYRLKPSFLLEVAFLIGVWLIAWRVFDPPVAVLVFIIFAAYGLVFLYENWLDSVSRRERAESRRSLRKEGELHRDLRDPSPQSRPASTVKKLTGAEPVAVSHSISERLTAKLHGHEVEEESRSAAPATAAPPAPASSVPSAPAARVAEQSEREKPPGAPAQPASRERVEPVLPSPTTIGTPRSVSEAASVSRNETVPRERPDELEQPHSLMAEIAAGPDARRAAGPVGGWNVWQLERLLAAQAKPDPERDYERSMMLVYLREFADSDGQLPPQFDDLVRESFSDLVRGPAS
jgi:ribosomal protein L12E/L44/L45/RPP1/RPP2